MKLNFFLTFSLFFLSFLFSFFSFPISSWTQEKNQRLIHRANIEKTISGLRWTLARDNEETFTVLTYGEAEIFCKSLKGHIPTQNEYEILGKGMGRGTEAGYNPKFFDGFDISYHYFWSSTLAPLPSPESAPQGAIPLDENEVELVWSFQGQDGTANQSNLNRKISDLKSQVICVSN